MKLIIYFRGEDDAQIPNWNAAPEWAQWVAQDADGKWYWYQHRPIAYTLCMYWGGGGSGNTIRISGIRPPE